jgi:hypothetical protein
MRSALFFLALAAFVMQIIARIELQSPADAYVDSDAKEKKQSLQKPRETANELKEVPWESSSFSSSRSDQITSLTKFRVVAVSRKDSFCIVFRLGKVCSYFFSARSRYVFLKNAD